MEATCYFLVSLSESEIFDVIQKEHLSSGHGGRDVVQNKTSLKYANVTKQLIQMFVDLCEDCQLKKSKIRKGIVVKPIISNGMNCRCQVDLIDMQSQPDNNFKYILNYQDHLTKFCVLRPLKSKQAEEVAYHVLDIFCFLGSPHILQSDNGREFANSVVNELVSMWPQCRIVHGKPRHSQSQGSVERANRDVEAILACWLKDNGTDMWSVGLRFVQWQKNNRLHSGIGRPPYQAMFGERTRLVGSDVEQLPDEIWENITSEEELGEALNINIPTEEDDSNDCEAADELELCNSNDQQHVTAKRCNVCDEVFDEKALNYCSNCKGICHGKPPCSYPVDNDGHNDDHEKCDGVLCHLCHRDSNIEKERHDTKRSLEKQANKMLQSSNKRFKPLSVGENVMVPIPDVDRGRVDFRNVKAVVKEANVNMGLYTIGTIHGTLKQQYIRNQLIPTKASLVTVSEIPDGEVTLREVARKDSLGSGQGFQRCHCRSGCDRNLCSCKKASRLCNSKCHNSLSCNNK